MKFQRKKPEMSAHMNYSHEHSADGMMQKVPLIADKPKL